MKKREYKGKVYRLEEQVRALQANNKALYDALVKAGPPHTQYLPVYSKELLSHAEEVLQDPIQWIKNKL